MRTYRRKKQEFQVIDNVKELCRLCLERSDDTVPIFKDEETPIAALALRVMVCVGVVIQRDEELPNIICAACHEELEKHYAFRKKCEVSYQKLKSHLCALKILENSRIKEEEEKIVKLKAKENAEKHIIDKLENDDNIHELDRIEIQLIEQDNDEAPDIQSFLSSILTELGILTQSDRGVGLLDEGVRSFELETDDNDLISLELVEEDDDEESPAEEPEIKEVVPETEENDLVLDVPTKKKRRKKKKRNSAWCDVCGRSFVSVSAVARHMAVHSGRRPHVCACGRSFAQKAVLARHALVHAARRPFPCPHCDKAFTQRGALAAHAHTHAAPHARPLALHSCQHCDKVFLYSSGLTRHMRTHAGVSHSCEYCARVFNDMSSLIRHTRTKHENQAAGTPPTQASDPPVSSSDPPASASDPPASTSDPPASASDPPASSTSPETVDAKPDS